jgi:hypothetical protein
MRSAPVQPETDKEDPMSKILKTMLLAAVATATPALAAPRDTPEVQLQKAIAGRVAGEPTSCITLSNTQSSRIIEGKAIIYRVGSTLYVNEPRSGADWLDDDDILVTKTYGSQLCRIDSVQLIDRTSRFQRGFVILGDFVPYRKPPKAN